jgi:hypothetical protein
MHKLSKILMALTILVATTAEAGLYPSLVLKNQFGEQSNNYVIGGSDQIDVTFVVDPTNTNGLGIHGLAVQGSPALVQNIYMHTAETPASGNPNPANGYVLIQLASSSYTGYIAGAAQFFPPESGTPINVSSGVTLGNAYVITSVGTTTQAGFSGIGLPAGVVPAVGAGFIAAGMTTASGSGQVQAPVASGAYNFEMISANQLLSATGGGFVLGQIVGPTSVSNPTPIAVAPVAGTIVKLHLVMH